MLKVRIETKNAAFDQENLTLEIENCFKEVIERLYQGFTESNIHDTNGNVTGNFKLTNR